jgi:DNA-binding NarL/FixJ family response regulator
MAEQPKITEKQIAAFASDQKTASGVPRRPSYPGWCFTADLTKRPHADRHLENTLVNNIGISEPLTKREVQILHSILAGKTNKQMALMLSRSRRTIEYHRNRLMRKLNARNTVELVKRAVAMGIA